MHTTHTSMCVFVVGGGGAKVVYSSNNNGLAVCAKQANLSESSSPGSNKRPKEEGVGGGDTSFAYLI